MATANKKSSSPSTAAFHASAWDSARITSLTMGAANNPERVDECQKRVRYWFENNWMVRQIVLLRQSFYDFGFKLLPVVASQASVLAKWSESQAAVLDRYRRDAWEEVILQDSAVAVWRSGGKPVVFPVENCRYSDAFGDERLSIRHGLSHAQIDDMQLDPGQKRALKASTELTLRHADRELFGFDVVTRARTGSGLAMPGMKSVFTALAQAESMEVGDNLLAGVGRDAIVQHKLGHEIKSGPQAGSKAHFATDAKVKKVIDGMKGRAGVITIGTNFDHSFDFPRPDPKHFDGKKYDAVIKRLALWAMPLGQMVLERSLNPYLLPVLKMQALKEREMMAGHLARVFSAMSCPVPFRIVWSNRCFTDSRTFTDLLKFGLTSGPLSQRTFITEAGYDVTDERTFKTEEGKLPAEMKEPAFDVAHGNGNAKGKSTGRTPGSPDNPQ